MDPEILNTVLDAVEEEPIMADGFMRLFNSLKLSAVPVNPLPIVILMKTETETEALKSVIREISNIYAVYTFDTLDRVHTETSISQRAEMVPVSPARAKAIIMDMQFSQDPDMHRVMEACGLLELMVVLLSSDETLALQMAAVPTKLHEDLPPRDLSMFRFGFEEPALLLGHVLQLILRAFMNELVNWIRNHSPPRAPIEE